MFTHMTARVYGEKIGPRNLDKGVKNKPTLTFWFLVLIGGFFRTACKASIRFPVQGWLRMQQQNNGVTLNYSSSY